MKEKSNKIYRYTISFVNCPDNPVVKDILQTKIVEAETAKPELYHDFTFLLTPEQLKRVLESKRMAYLKWLEPNQYGFVTKTKEEVMSYYNEAKDAILKNGIGQSKWQLPAGTLIWKHFKNHSKLVYTA
jgi:hypothetical protein